MDFDMIHHVRCHIQYFHFQNMRMNSLLKCQNTCTSLTQKDVCMVRHIINIKELEKLTENSIHLLQVT